jgi:UDP-N-acetyl-D-glucosamine dehydrogenase
MKVSVKEQRDPIQHQHALVARIAARKTQVGVMGLGHIGLPLALAASACGFRLTGFDVDHSTVALLNEGKSPLRHISLAAIEQARQTSQFTATSDFSHLAACDIIVICVPTPLASHREPDLSFVIEAVKTVAAHLRGGQLVVLASTSYPGTTAEVVRPILEAAGLREGFDFFLAYAGEREDPGNARYSAAQIPRVIGADNVAALVVAKAFYETFVEQVIPVCSTQTAEAVKITENVFRAVNVALVNELKIIYSKMGIDIFEVIAAAKTKPFGFMPFYPGPGIGGHCIPVDPFYLAWKAREYQVSARFVELASEINAEMPRHVVDRVATVLNDERQRGLSLSHILVVGVAYKRDVDDTRESPALVIMELLQERGALVDYHDPFVLSLPTMRNRPLLEGKQSVALTGGSLRQYDIVVVVTDHSVIDWPMLVSNAPIIVDTRNICARHDVGRANIFSA